MSLPSGTRVGPYEITAQIGAGGMGEVYRARDIRLNRDVALKILPEAFAADPDRLARFTREAQLLASLNHPNIAGIYGLEESDGVRALALELVDGPTLAERIAPGALPVDEALPMARQMADALEAAHEHGIVHRDLKPANVKVTADGVVKVLDFGLAKLVDAGDRSVRLQPDLTASPTVTTPGMVTGVGVILGTAAYMAPEQAKGRPADKRADVWAFGCVLYEMLTGRAPFAGDDVSDTLANVLKREPDWSALPRDTPPAIRALLRRCLDKDRRTRASDIAAAIFAVDEAIRLSPAPSATQRRSQLERLAIPAAGLLAGVLLGGTVIYLRPASDDAPEMRLEIATPSADRGGVDFAMSPDGRHIGFRAAAAGRPQLWMRALESDAAQPLNGTDDGTDPCWSTDSRSIAFFSDQKLKRVDVEGGPVQILADAPTSYGCAWGDGAIVFAPANTSALYRIAPSGGQPTEVTSVDRPRHTGHRRPWFLPDGRRFLFFVVGEPDVQGVYIGALDSQDTRRLVQTDAAAVFVRPDYLLFGRDGALYGQRIDIDGLRTVGEPFPVADRIVVHPVGFASIAISASMTGLLAYRKAEDSARGLSWVDRMGREIGSLGRVDGLTDGVPRISPDARTVSVTRYLDGHLDVWLLDSARGLPRRLIPDADVDHRNVIWSPDGRRIALDTNRKGGGGPPFDLSVHSGDTDAQKSLLESAENKAIQDWSPDGRFILYSPQGASTGWDLWALPLDGDRKPFPLVRTAFEERGARFSPDGRWVSYESNETGRTDIFIRPFPGPGRSWQISTEGGTEARWRGDGREIFHVAPDNRMMAVPVALDASASTVDAGGPVALFSLRPGSTYDVTRDGQRFLINAATGEVPTPPITIVLNWKPPAR